MFELEPELELHWLGEVRAELEPNTFMTELNLSRGDSGSTRLGYTLIGSMKTKQP